MKNYFELINNRRSIRNYDPKKNIPDNILKKILEAGRIAPSAANRQPWKFVIVKDHATRSKINESYSRDWFHHAPYVLVAIGYPDQAWVRPDGYNAIETDLTIAMDHMILAAESLGIGTCWIAAFDSKILKEALNLKGEEVIYSISPLGYPHDDYKKKNTYIRKDFDQVAEII
jgi:nitroreductase